MSKFAGAEYGPYLALCRALRLERDFTIGDWYLLHGPFPALVESDVDGVHTADGCVWVPELSDWLDLLQESGVDDVAFVQIQTGWVASTLRQPRRWERGFASREEAVARLWIMVEQHQTRKVANGNR